MKIKTDLVFDVGMHRGHDTAFYLSQGFKVIAVEANPDLCVKNALKFKNEIVNGKLIILNVAISNIDNDEIDFYISDHSSWSSAEVSLASRKNTKIRTVKVLTRTLKSIIDEYGIPYFCKIDIEGYDHIALESLQGLSILPKFLSVESESSNDIYSLTEEQYKLTLFLLTKLGYNKFKLIDQASLVQLEMGGGFYVKKQIPYLLKRILEKLLRIKAYMKASSFFFKPYIIGDTSGVFGEMLGRDNWKSLDESIIILETNRRDLINTKPELGFSFWCDWHATY